MSDEAIKEVRWFMEHDNPTPPQNPQIFLDGWLSALNGGKNE